MGFDFDEKGEGEKEIENTQPVESASPKQAIKNKKGLVPTHWIISFFSGSVPTSESSKLLDWSIFNGERFAGKCPPFPRPLHFFDLRRLLF
jgi:hypothetical protein